MKNYEKLVTFSTFEYVMEILIKYDYQFVLIYLMDQLSLIFRNGSIMIDRQYV